MKELRYQLFPVGPSGTELLVVPVLTSELLLVLIVLIVRSPSSSLLGLWTTWTALRGLLSGPLIETVGALIGPVVVSLLASWPWGGGMTLSWSALWGLVVVHGKVLHKWWYDWCSGSGWSRGRRIVPWPLRVFLGSDCLFFLLCHIIHKFKYVILLCIWTAYTV